MKELVEKVAALYADFSKDANAQIENCLLYTSDAADEPSRV